MLNFIKLSAKQKAALKLYIHGFIALETVAIAQYLASTNGKFDWASFGWTAVGAVALPITHFLARIYSTYAIKYPWLKPLAAYLALRAAKQIASAKSHLATPIPTTKP